MNKNSNFQRGQVMLHQHNINTQAHADSALPSAILVPLDLPDLKILSQALHPDGSLEKCVIVTTDRQACPTCQHMCVKVHDTRGWIKRDIALRGYQVHFLLLKRRFRFMACQRTFTEPDSVCGR